MNISKQEIIQKFEELISNDLTHEDIVAWALEKQKAEDIGILNYIPLSEKDIIWNAVVYLACVDLKVNSYEYLHSIENFLEEKEKLKI